MTEREWLDRITVDPEIFGGKSVIQGYPWLKSEDIQACVLRMPYRRV